MEKHKGSIARIYVPNVPCGVESQDAWANINSWTSEFLMYRVELKVAILATLMISFAVPNVPCGVERGV